MSVLRITNAYLSLHTLDKFRCIRYAGFTIWLMVVIIIDCICYFNAAYTLPCYFVPSSRIRLLATALTAPLHPALLLATRLMLLMVAPLECPLSVSSHLYLCLGLLLAPFIIPSITSSSIPHALTTCPE